MKLVLTRFSLRFPWLVILLVLLTAGFFAAQLPKVHFDNDPENMLAADEPVRLFHHQVKEKYALYDFVIVGISNEEDPNGIFNVGTLGRIHDLTYALLHLQQADDGHPEIRLPERNGLPGPLLRIDLTPQSWWQQGLNHAFMIDPNRLFDEAGQSAIINRELIAPSVVDNLKQAELGSLKLEYLMEHPPKTQQQALQIRDDAIGNPLYYGTLVAEDSKAICLYLPIAKKTYSYNVSSLVRYLTAEWPEADQVHITGLPIAEDTFGVEMLVQMATSAPLAMLAIFLLLLLFFRRVSLVIAPMLVALVSVVCTMGLLIGLGYDVHIMSSMIAIFLMPIAVADSVHLLSEFHDSYHRFGNKRETLLHVVKHLFTPMLYTTLTTMAGFGSLMFTPIPPVKIFGAHVAFGVGLAWLLTMTLVPAYAMLAMSEKSLERLQRHASEDGGHRTLMSRMLESLGRFSCRRRWLILGITAGTLIVALVGIGRIQVNDNPVKWFVEDHPIRQADKVLNQHFGGTYTAYLSLQQQEVAKASPQALVVSVQRAVTRSLQPLWGGAAAAFNRDLEQVDPWQDFPESLLTLAADYDDRLLAGWQWLADELVYLDPADLDLAQLSSRLESMPDLPTAEFQELLDLLAGLPATGEALVEAALQRVEGKLQYGFIPLVESELTAWAAPAFKQPEVLLYLAGLQAFLAEDQVVGKTTSAVDALKKANYELQYQPALTAEANRLNFAIPDSVAAVAQVYSQLEGMKKKDSLFHLVTRDYQGVNLWVQLKSGDNRDMEEVVAAVEEFFRLNPPPVPLDHAWAGLTYLNVVWQEKMVNGMLASLASSFVVVLVMMIILFRSLLFGLLAMLPLSVTITLIYGVIGLVGKDYDMPVAVLSAMTLGLSVDFAIHFLERARQLYRDLGSWDAAVQELFREPALAISRNAVIISIGFTPLLLAPLVPYQTVGFFLATIMAVSWLTTLLLLPALLSILQRRLFRSEVKTEVSPSAESSPKGTK
jgi:predicted RND superfamily exporter protein